MAKKNDSQPSEPTFEQLVGEAEGLAEKMEEGGLTLEESIKAFEKGVDNIKKASQLLRGAEERVKLLVERNGVFQLEDLDAEDDPDLTSEEVDEA